MKLFTSFACFYSKSYCRYFMCRLYVLINKNERIKAWRPAAADGWTYYLIDRHGKAFYLHSPQTVLAFFIFHSLRLMFPDISLIPPYPEAKKSVKNKIYKTFLVTFPRKAP
jgi:hypothetical protein